LTQRRLFDVYPPAWVLDDEAEREELKNGTVLSTGLPLHGESP
jgi:hypothetical protein